MVGLCPADGEPAATVTPVCAFRPPPDAAPAARQQTGWLRVAASVGFGRLKLLPLVQTFLQAHPGVKVDLRLNDGFVDLVEQGIDVAVRIGYLADSSLMARRIGTTRRALLASRRYLRGLPKGAEGTTGA